MKHIGQNIELDGSNLIKREIKKNIFCTLRTFCSVLWRGHHRVPLAPLRADQGPPAGLGQLPTVQLGERGNLRLYAFQNGK